MFPSILFPEVLFPGEVFPHDDSGLVSGVFDEDLQTYLSAKLGQTIYPLYRPQTLSLPCFTYTQISLDRMHTIAGRAGIVTAEYQVSCWSVSYLGAKQMALAVRDALDGYAGFMASTTVRGCFSTDEQAMYNAPISSNDKGTFHRACMYTIVYVEP